MKTPSAARSAKPVPASAAPAKDEDSAAKMDPKQLERQRAITGLSGERMRDLFARLLTNLGAVAPAAGKSPYVPWDANFDPYVYKYW